MSESHTALLLGAEIIAFAFNSIFIFISDANHGRYGAYTLISGLETRAPDPPSDWGSAEG